MLSIGDYALHQKTGQLGQVFGYGHQIINGAYFTTLKVMLTTYQGNDDRSRFVEDVYSTWSKAQN
ncbi:hypothetical protein I8752_04820 [Nostocaceae cyanobacterium CENA369]|uniref:Uncharacterized protein n=1 Tax=Dendronalium phyllosphericum CENA369 TaxID=1725256 RepID=A0A8J7I4J7_9NOST|nr:hypothetical protein [Dendronalium phyllosphericum]MBH8572367.1 hypothetical protein [Dendronalium phyllosphericum CENA369]